METGCSQSKAKRPRLEVEPSKDNEDIEKRPREIDETTVAKESSVSKEPESPKVQLKTVEAEAAEDKGAKESSAFKEPKSPKFQLKTFVEAEAAEDKGSRHAMEDAWVILPDARMGKNGPLRCSHFAIYDGHGGRHAAEYARAHLHSNVLSAGLPLESTDSKAAKRAIIEGFKRTDEDLLQESASGGWQDGATAVSVWVLGQMVFVANVGDAKAVLARIAANESGEINETTGLKGVVVTREHKAIFPVERTRIQKSGGYVAENGRLLGRLEVSRAFGDRMFKKVGVTAVPDVHMFELTQRERFLILGCDGLWGVFGPTDAVEFVNSHLKDGATPSMACKRLVREAVRERRCKDNCTAILIAFNHIES